MNVSTSKRYGAVDEEVVGSWLASLDVSNATKRNYELGFRHWARFIKECGYDFDNLDESHVVEFKNYLMQERGYSPSAVSLYLNAVRSFYRYSESRDLRNIARNVKGVPAARDFKKEALTVSQAKMLLASLDRNDEVGLRDRALISLMLHTGLRDVEVARANVGSIGNVGDSVVLHIQGKGRKEADALVKLVPRVHEEIKRYLAERGHPELNAPLFTSCANRNAGSRLTTRSISRIVKEALRGIGLDDPRYTAHSLRHTAITLALLNGATDAEAQQMARHADISTTMIYSHHIKRLENAAEDRVSDLLD